VCAFLAWRKKEGRKGSKKREKAETLYENDNINEYNISSCLLWCCPMFDGIVETIRGSLTSKRGMQTCLQCLHSKFTTWTDIAKSPSRTKSLGQVPLTI
jgi:hypothetical protein